MKKVFLILALQLVLGLSVEASQHLKCIEQNKLGAKISFEIEYGKNIIDRGVATIVDVRANKLLEQLVVVVELDSSGYAPFYIVRNFEWNPRLDMTLTAAGGDEYIGSTILVMDGGKRELTVSCQEVTPAQQ